MHWTNYHPVLGTQPLVQPQNMQHCIILKNVTHSFTRAEEIASTMNKCFSKHQKILKSFSLLTFPSSWHAEEKDKFLLKFFRPLQLAVSGISSMPVQSMKVLTLHWGKFLLHRKQTSVSCHLGSYLSAGLVHHTVIFQFTQNACRRCHVVFGCHSCQACKFAGSILVCTQVFLCRENGHNDSLLLASSQSIMVKCVLRLEQALSGWKEKRWGPLSDSQCWTPSLLYFMNGTCSCDFSLVTGSYLAMACPTTQPWSLRDRSCQCYNTELQNLLLSGEWGWHLTAM